MKLPLTTPLASIAGIGPAVLKRLDKLGLKTVRDLIWHFPVRYEDFSKIYNIADLEPGTQATIQGRVASIKVRRSWRRHFVIVEAVITDETGEIRAVWFNQPYLLNVLSRGRLANFAGKVSVNEDGIFMNHPSFELVPAIPARQIQTNMDNFQRKSALSPRESAPLRHTGRLVPVYSETKGLTSKWLRALIQPILKNLENPPEWIPPEILAKCNLPEINTALHLIHFPEEITDAESARRRFSFEDLFLLQILNAQIRMQLAAETASALSIPLEHFKQILGELPFELTRSQKQAVWEVMQDLEKPRPMNRLLQGDVGSGKTVVAALAAIIAAHNGCQTAIMAPTEVLAQQHFATFKKLLGGIKSVHQPAVGLFTSANAKIFYENDLETEAKKSALLKKISQGEVKIVIGTHALIQKNVGFRNLGLIVVDEQHRFGVHQRSALMRGHMQTDTQTDVEIYSEDNFLYEDITYKIRSAVFNVRKGIGLGHKEIIYQKALEEEFKKLNINFEKEKIIDVRYGDKKIGIYKPDFVVENKIIVELKALPFIGKSEEKQIWTHLKGSQYRLALLVNFSKISADIKRIIYDTAHSGQRLSALSRHLSAKMVPHFLSMSATPIPRTLTLTLFGDLDVSLITELPGGRKPVSTRVVQPQERKGVYDFIRSEIQNGRQAFVICPRIDPTQTDAGPTRTDTENFPRGSVLSPDKSVTLWETKAVKEEYEKLSKQIFPELKIAILHGKMRPAEKEKTMREFREKQFDILVSTSVIEVGVDIPNATMIMIEGAERFGLAQLYQLRGRVGRGEHQSYCFLLTDSASQNTAARLRAILSAKNGFELAEEDLKLRGPGQFFGERQTGLPDIAMQSLQDIGLVKLSKDAAVEFLKTDLRLERHPILREHLREFEKKIHLE